MNFSITRNGKKLKKSLYTWDKETKTLSTRESGLVLDFSGTSGVTFNTGSDCTFRTGNWCIFNTIMSCTFNTGQSCTFNTGSNCVFNTGDRCIFKTGSSCTFKTGSHCTFDTIYNCTFKTEKNCVIIRRDIYEVIETSKYECGILTGNFQVKIKLNDYGIKGYTVIPDKETIKIFDQEYYKDEVGKRLQDLRPVK